MTDSSRETRTAPRHRRPSHLRPWKIVGFLALLISGVVAFIGGWTLQSTVATSAGAPAKVIIATWLRDNNLEWFVAKLEDVYFTYISTPEQGGLPTISADFGDDEPVQEPSPQPSPSTPTQVVPSPPTPEPTETIGLTPPKPLTPPEGLTPQEMEGQWQPVGTQFDGIPAVYVTRVRADPTYSSYYATAMWIDTSLTSAMFVPGFEEPAGGPNPFNGALPDDLQASAVASFNGGFRLKDSLGGYFYDGTMVKDLVDGKASAVVYRDGTMRIGSWGRDYSLDDSILAVRQNLDLIVDDGVSQVTNANDNVIWGATTDKSNMTWRAGVGERADGSLVYVIGEYLTAPMLADTLIAAGVERAMVLDMNEYWAAGFYYRTNKKGELTCKFLEPNINGTCDRFLRPYKRDSFHMLLRDQPLTTSPTSDYESRSLAP